MTEFIIQWKEMKLRRRWSVVSSTLSGRMTKWNGTLYSELEDFWLESHRCPRSGCGTQPHYEAPHHLQVLPEIVLWLTLDKWDCLNFIYLFIHSFICSVIYLFIYLFICLFIYIFICLFIYLFIYSFIYLSIYLFKSLFTVVLQN